MSAALLDPPSPESPGPESPDREGPVPGCPAPGEAGEASPKRRAVLDAAGQLFLDQGYAAVSMDAVARAAGVSKATLYAHFSGKDALFGAIVGERCLAMAEQTKASIDPALPIGEALRELGRSWLSFILRPTSIAIHRVVMAEGGRFPDLTRAFHESGPRRGRAWIGEWVAGAQRRGQLRPDAEPRVMAGHFVALLRGDLYFDAVLGFLPDEFDAAVAAAVASAVEVFLRAYGTGGAAGAGDAAG